jgi:MFS family permease
MAQFPPSGSSRPGAPDPSSSGGSPFGSMPPGSALPPSARTAEGSPNELVFPAKEGVEGYALPSGMAGYMIDPPPVMPTKPVVPRPPRGDDEPRGAAARPRNRTGNTGSWWELFGYQLLVFLSSVCVMTLELTASRLLAKHVGSSLYTWTSVIGVVLAGITLGNWFGGYLSDRFDRAKMLAGAFLMASLTCASVLWMDLWVAGFDRPGHISWPVWVLCIVATVFFLPAVALGVTSPLIASLALSRSRTPGQTVGNVYAWGAAGSIVGTFLTGFYLVDVFGTRAIIGMTAATLALLAIIVAGGRWAFRAAVITGWLQCLFALSLMAAATPQQTAQVAGAVGRLPWPGGSPATAVWDESRWSLFGQKLGTALQELGLLLQLRDDQVGEYSDESPYSQVAVIDDVVNGVNVKALKLDKLVHSYYDPLQPTSLHYEYEQVYAAVTRQLAAPPPSAVVVPVPTFPRDEFLDGPLPAGVRFSTDHRELTVDQITADRLSELMRLASDSEYWRQIERLGQATREPGWNGFASVRLEQLPKGVEFPSPWAKRIRFDNDLKTLIAYEALSVDDEQQLIQLSAQGPWWRVLKGLQRQTTDLKTFFIGGGGYIFPRWIAQEFPAARKIDVAELDAAVLTAVRQNLGLTTADEQRIKTTVGDARMVIADLLKAQRQLQPASSGTYDVIYGDAFNDFGVPWHLTTLEFNQQLAELLTERGAYLANIIDIYPRTTIPNGVQGKAEVTLPGPLPPELFTQPFKSGDLPPLKSRWQPLQVTRQPDGQFRLTVTAPLPLPREQALAALPEGNPGWSFAIAELARLSREPQALSVALPAALQPSSLERRVWLRCTAPFDTVEVMWLTDAQVVLSLRGAATDALQQQLLDLLPNDPSWSQLVRDGVDRSRRQRPGQFLARCVQTLVDVYPSVAVFSTAAGSPSDIRDTFVLVASKQPRAWDPWPADTEWPHGPFAVYTKPADEAPQLRGHMAALLQLADGQRLTDDFAPVDTLLGPVFSDQD